MIHHIIIGNGIAANTAAETIRKCEPNSSIRMFSLEKHSFYYMPALPEFLSGEKDVKGMTLHAAQWYTERNIELHLSTAIASIDPARKTVITVGNDTYAYDKLLLATGGYSFVPPITGADSLGVYSLRTLADAETIKAKSRTGKKTGPDRRRPARA